MKLSEALPLAEMYLEKLSPATIRAEIVGSVKRRKAEVHDIEILMIAKSGHPRPEMGQKKIYLTHLDKLLDEFQHDGLLQTANNPANGQKLKRREIVGANFITGFNIELFIVTPNTWGIQNMIRTGNSWFSHRAVTNQDSIAIDRTSTDRMARGFMPNDLRYVKGKDLESGESCIKRGDEILSLPEERDVIELIFGKWIEPCDRALWAER